MKYYKAELYVEISDEAAESEVLREVQAMDYMERHGYLFGDMTEVLRGEFIAVLRINGNVVDD